MKFERPQDSQGLRWHGAMNVSELHGKIVTPGESALIDDGMVIVLGRAFTVMTWTNVFTSGANPDPEAPVGATFWG